jgi:hypothetical protein
MRTLRWTTPLALAALAAAPAGAQQMGTMHGAGHEGMMGQGMMQMCPMMGGQAMAGHEGKMSRGGMAGMDHAMAGAGALFGGVDLGLTSDQRAELDAVVATAREEHRAHMREAMSVQAGAAEALTGPQPDLGAYERTVQEAATHMAAAHVALAKASVEARSLLTPDQVAKLPQGAQLFNTMMCGMMGGEMMDGPAAGGGHDQHHR